ncbi:nuclear transport factor 2 family protein [Sphingomicrobium clamense]|uniref:Nuclear transport factor 2 family protein n=1 Tax=Sphingomicrobium clamense TaxID=2851013 RepID=A0ABS6V2N2_9SPHN|nr:nuclear transport factor 2 family protein [Sphingomicrobium sp. B8]MBW0143815.1 nuclear transport factor 2 family protein [Sphingomicrobium sp. B8]
MMITMAMALIGANALDTQDRCAGAVEAVQAAYVDGIWRNRDAEAVANGFHENFVMQAVRDGAVASISIDDWVGGRMDGTPNEDTVEADLELLDCSGDMAMVRGELSVNGTPTFIDVLGLYRLDGDWKIVTKQFVRP